jgi:hypothetical protein
LRLWLSQSLPPPFPALLYLRSLPTSAHLSVSLSFPASVRAHVAVALLVLSLVAAFVSSLFGPPRRRPLLHHLLPRACARIPISHLARVPPRSPEHAHTHTLTASLPAPRPCHSNCSLFCSCRIVPFYHHAHHPSIISVLRCRRSLLCFRFSAFFFCTASLSSNLRPPFLMVCAFLRVYLPYR